MKKEQKLNLFRIAVKGLIRFKLWFILRLFILLLWGLLIFNLYTLYDLKFILIKNDLHLWTLLSSLIVLCFLTLLSILIIIAHTFKLRQNEFGLYRCCGSRRSEIFLLILNEGFILSFFSLVLILAAELFVVLYFKGLIINYFSISYNFQFTMQLFKGFGLSSLVIILGLTLAYIPFGFYYIFKDPYNIIKH